MEFKTTANKKAFIFVFLLIDILVMWNFLHAPENILLLFVGLVFASVAFTIMYALNFILKNRERIHVVTHSKKKKIQEDAKNWLHFCRFHFLMPLIYISHRMIELPDIKIAFLRKWHRTVCMVSFTKSKFSQSFQTFFHTLIFSLPKIFFIFFFVI
jgi:hypothetical protein